MYVCIDMYVCMIVIVTRPHASLPICHVLEGLTDCNLPTFLPTYQPTTHRPRGLEHNRCVPPITSLKATRLEYNPLHRPITTLHPPIHASTKPLAWSTTDLFHQSHRSMQQAWSTTRFIDQSQRSIPLARPRLSCRAPPPPLARPPLRYCYYRRRWRPHCQTRRRSGPSTAEVSQRR